MTDGTITVQEFHREVAALARKNKITLPMNVGVRNSSSEPKHDGDLEDLHQRIDLAYRRNRGQFFTPPDVAEFMVGYGADVGAKTMLDPTCGLGVFIDKMLETRGRKCRIFGIDKDPSMINACYLNIKTRHKAKSKNVRLYNQDYLESDNLEKVDFLVCNPPYINFHGFDRKSISRIGQDFGVKFSMLTNIYALFMVKAKRSVKRGGRIAFITPSEFFYTGYGKTLKKFLLENFTIDSLITFDFDSTVFDGALTTATVTLMVNKEPRPDHRVRFVKMRRSLGRVVNVSHLSKEREARVSIVAQKTIDPNVKWQSYFEDSGIPDSLMKSLVPLSTIASVKRGIATGSNAFFTLSDAEKNQWRIKDDVLVPVISKATQISGYRLTKNTIKTLGKNGHKIHLLYCFGAPSQGLSKYIKHGEGKGVDAGYLCSRRSPWYSMERREPAPILSTVFSRNNMRFVHNKARCLNLASYHGIYPHFNSAEMVEALLCYLNSDLCMSIQKLTRREYGNGLHKFEPSDLLALPTLPIDKVGKTDLSKLASLFRRMARASPKESGIRCEIDDTVLQIAKSLNLNGGKK